MKVTEENIQQINKRLKKFNVSDVDIRFELIDHFAEELKSVEGNFDEVFENYFLSKKDMIHRILKAAAIRQFVIGLPYVLKELFSARFILCYTAIFSGFYFLTATYGRQFIIGHLLGLPIWIAFAVPFLIFYHSLYKKDFTAKSNSILFFVNLFVVSYAFFGMGWIKNTGNFGWLFLFSFYVSMSFYSYYIYFKIRKDEKKYLKLV